VIVHIDDQTGVVDFSGTGYAGRAAGLNNPEMQNVQNTGPIPQGFYIIEIQQDNVTAAGKTLSASMRLTPFGTNEMFGREGFLLIFN
jgi:hypothetical protein